MPSPLPSTPSPSPQQTYSLLAEGGVAPYLLASRQTYDDALTLQILFAYCAPRIVPEAQHATA